MTCTCCDGNLYALLKKTHTQFFLLKPAAAVCVRACTVALHNQAATKKGSLGGTFGVSQMFRGTDIAATEGIRGDSERLDLAELALR